jgi:PAS domain S-box-containing protein
MSPSDRSAYLQAIFDSLPVGVLVADDHAVYVDANPAACKLLGRSREQIIGTCVGDIAAPGRRSDTEEQWRAFLKHGSQSGVIEIRLPDGQTRNLHFQGFAGFVPGMHCSFLTLEPGMPIQTAAREGLLTICPWTHRVLFEGSWISFEDYLQQAHGVLVTHGISPDAFPTLES